MSTQTRNLKTFQSHTRNDKNAFPLILRSNAKTYEYERFISALKVAQRVAVKLVSAPASEALSFIKFQKTFLDSLNSAAIKAGLGVMGEIQDAKFELATKYCKETQTKLLEEILELTRETEYGQKHGFSKIKTVADFQKNVPVNTYDDLMPYVERHIRGEKNLLVPCDIVSYATTSGTTGKPKYIPITAEVKKNAHQKMSKLFAHSLVKEKPKTLDRKILAIVSPAEEGRTPDGTVFGSTSGQIVKEMGSAIKRKYLLPYEVLTIEDYNSKYYCILLLGMSDEISLLSSANPSTLNLLAQKGNEWRDSLLADIESGTLKKDLELTEETRKIVEAQIKPRPKRAQQLRKLIANDPDNLLRPRHYWPNLQTIACWTGGNSNIFLTKMKKWYGENVAIRDLGYLASELRGSLPLSCKSSDGVLTIKDNFFEFVNVADIEEESPKYLLAHELKIGQQYYLFFTNKSGLYRYNINDIVEVRNFKNNTPTIVFIQKGKGVTNITGEKIYEQQIMAVMEEVEKEMNIKSNFYMALADANNAKYELFIEFADADQLDYSKKEMFLNSYETKLQKMNIEYAAKRKSLRLKPFGLRVLASESLDTFKAWRISQGIREAQFKTVPLTSDIKLIAPLNVIEQIEIK